MDAAAAELVIKTEWDIHYKNCDCNDCWVLGDDKEPKSQREEKDDDDCQLVGEDGTFSLLWADGKFRSLVAEKCKFSFRLLVRSTTEDHQNHHLLNE